MRHLFNRARFLLRQTVFFQYGGGLLLVAVILVSFPLTALFYPNLQNLIQSTTPQSPLFRTASDSCSGLGIDVCLITSTCAWNYNSSSCNKITSTCKRWADLYACNADTAENCIWQNANSSSGGYCKEKSSSTNSPQPLPTPPSAGPAMPAANTDPQCNAAPGAGDCSGGAIINDKSGTPMCNNYTGHNTQIVCGTNNQYFTCNNGTWESTGGSCGTGANFPPGSCFDGKIIDYITGNLISTSYVGTNGIPVCGTDHQNWLCQNGAWIPQGGACGLNCTGSGKILYGSTCWSTSAAACPGGQYVCQGSGPICQGSTQPTSPAGGGGGNGGGGTNPTVPPSTPTLSATLPPTASPTLSPTLSPTSPVATATTGPGTPTATTAPTGTNIALTLTLDGIGSNTGVGQNNNPQPNSRSAQIQIFDSSGQQVGSNSSANLTYDSASSGFKGTAPVNATAGTYKIKVRFDNTLWKAINGVTVTSGQTTNTPATHLISGDVNGDNQLNLFDYNSVLSCYGAKACNQKTASDLNMDGKVDELDINILYKQFSTRQGD